MDALADIGLILAIVAAVAQTVAAVFEIMERLRAWRSPPRRRSRGKHELNADVPERKKPSG